MAKPKRLRSRVVRRAHLLATRKNSRPFFSLKKCTRTVEKKDWDDLTCSVCMECPHDAVLLLCASFNKGCRPYMCDTGLRHSNCLEQYRKAYGVPSNSGERPDNHDPVLDPGLGRIVEKFEGLTLLCPLCRGDVKGCAVVDPVREYLNAKQRNCVHKSCSFVGSYRDLKKHVHSAHPCGVPREIDPDLEQKWQRLEREQEHNDVVSTIRSMMPGAMVLGDYVLEGGQHEDNLEGTDPLLHAHGARLEFGRELGNVFNLLLTYGSFEELDRRMRLLESTEQDGDTHQGMEPQTAIEHHSSGYGGGISFSSRLRRHDRVLLNRSARRRLRREARRRGR